MIECNSCRERISQLKLRITELESKIKNLKTPKKQQDTDKDQALAVVLSVTEDWPIVQENDVQLALLPVQFHQQKRRSELEASITQKYKNFAAECGEIGRFEALRVVILCILCICEGKSDLDICQVIADVFEKLRSAATIKRIKSFSIWILKLAYIIEDTAEWRYKSTHILLKIFKANTLQLLSRLKIPRRTEFEEQVRKWLPLQKGLSRNLPRVSSVRDVLLKLLPVEIRGQMQKIPDIQLYLETLTEILSLPQPELQSGVSKRKRIEPNKENPSTKRSRLPHNDPQLGALCPWPGAAWTSETVEIHPDTAAQAESRDLCGDRDGFGTGAELEHNPQLSDQFLMNDSTYFLPETYGVGRLIDLENTISANSHPIPTEFEPEHYGVGRHVSELESTMCNNVFDPELYSINQADACSNAVFDPLQYGIGQSSAEMSCRSMPAQMSLVPLMASSPKRTTGLFGGLSSPSAQTIPLDNAPHVGFL